MGTNITEMFETAIKRIEKGWCQNAYFVDVSGRKIYEYRAPMDYHAVQGWCLNGACVLAHETYEITDYETAARPFLEQAIRELFPDTLSLGQTTANWNDPPSRAKEQVLAVLLRAKEMASMKAV